ncbi:class C sortase [Bifidobacterium sp. ESL0732]|uniref:class C sortase n=1 Tax=Bifidobacterium sp. ESL0732 TaxID=2983222 RepID=UPI0023FA144C|nr:class C sortase [Bifidobacterium sp. ESL0732]WEV63985.1 class C sortase [Bifidobacterium sp. ESL0732]
MKKTDKLGVVNLDASFESFFRYDPSARKHDWYSVAIHVMHDLLAILLVIAILWIPALQSYNARQEEAATDAVEASVGAWPVARIRSEINAARQYNVAIAQSGQGDLGEFSDPFGSSSGSSDAAKSDTNADAADNQEELIPPILRNSTYQRLLNVSDGIMGDIKIPKISVNLPIYHGTSKDALAKGIGHLRGTSLPVGGPSTNVVLSGHRGLPSALLFTRLDRMRKGDVFFLNVLRQKMAYRIIGIHVIDPSDTHLYTVVPGKELVTLMTCTPYGINTSRLILTAERTTLTPSEMRQHDPLFPSILTLVAVLLLGLGALQVRYYHHRIYPWPLHTDGIFRRRGGARHGN